MQLKNTQSVELTVQLKGGASVLFKPGETVDVDGRINWQENCFVKAEWLIEVEQPKPTKRQKTEQAE